MYMGLTTRIGQPPCSIMMWSDGAAAKLTWRMKAMGLPKAPRPT